jgi:hypothetical protein
VVREGGNRDAFEIALLPQDIQQNDGRRPGIDVPLKVDHIVKIPRPGALGERSDLLPERFGIVVSEDFDAVVRTAS